MSGLRLCTMAQWEIRRLFQLIRHEVFTVSPFLGSFLAPKCVPLGYCDEDRNRDEHCPIRPHKDTVLGAWAEKKAAAKAAGQRAADGLKPRGHRRPSDRHRSRELGERTDDAREARRRLVGGLQHLLVASAAGR